MKVSTNRSTSLNTSIITNLKDQGLLSDQTLVNINAIRLEDMNAVE